MSEVLYKIVNKQGKPLDGFYPNGGGWKARNIFRFSSKRYYIFSTKDEADRFLSHIRDECNLTRWNMSDKVKKIATSLKVSKESEI